MGIAMEIRVNGEIREWDRPVTILSLLQDLHIRPETVVVERNLKIIPREQMAGEPVEAGDTIEIIRFVGGG